VDSSCRAIGAHFSSRRPPTALGSIDGAARLRTVPCGEGGRSWREIDRSFEGNRWRRMCLRAAVHALTPRVAPLARTSPREGRRQPSARSTAPPAFARCHAARADALGGSSTGASRATDGAGCASVQLCMCIALETCPFGVSATARSTAPPAPSHGAMRRCRRLQEGDQEEVEGNTGACGEVGAARAHSLSPCTRRITRLPERRRLRRRRGTMRHRPQHCVIGRNHRASRYS